MNTIKKIIYLVIVIFTFSSCQKCVECTWEILDGNNYEYDSIYDESKILKIWRSKIEICSDNFESTFNDIKMRYKKHNYNCKQ